MGSFFQGKILKEKYIDIISEMLLILVLSPYFLCFFPFFCSAQLGFFSGPFKFFSPQKMWILVFDLERGRENGIQKEKEKEYKKNIERDKDEEIYIWKCMHWYTHK